MLLREQEFLGKMHPQNQPRAQPHHLHLVSRQLKIILGSKTQSRRLGENVSLNHNLSRKRSSLLRLDSCKLKKLPINFRRRKWWILGIGKRRKFYSGISRQNGMTLILLDFRLVPQHIKLLHQLLTSQRHHINQFPPSILMSCISRQRTSHHLFLHLLLSHLCRIGMVPLISI